MTDKISTLIKRNRKLPRTLNPYTEMLHETTDALEALLKQTARLISEAGKRETKANSEWAEWEQDYSDLLGGIRRGERD